MHHKNPENNLFKILSNAKEIDECPNLLLLQKSSNFQQTMENCHSRLARKQPKAMMKRDFQYRKLLR